MDEYQEPVLVYQQILRNNLLDQNHTRSWNLGHLGVVENEVSTCQNCFEKSLSF